MKEAGGHLRCVGGRGMAFEGDDPQVVAVGNVLVPRFVAEYVFDGDAKVLNDMVLKFGQAVAALLYVDEAILIFFEEMLKGYVEHPLKYYLRLSVKFEAGDCCLDEVTELKGKGVDVRKVIDLLFVVGFNLEYILPTLFNAGFSQGEITDVVRELDSYGKSDRLDEIKKALQS